MWILVHFWISGRYLIFSIALLKYQSLQTPIVSAIPLQYSYIAKNKNSLTDVWCVDRYWFTFEFKADIASSIQMAESIRSELSQTTDLSEVTAKIDNDTEVTKQ